MLTHRKTNNRHHFRYQKRMEQKGQEFRTSSFSCLQVVITKTNRVGQPIDQLSYTASCSSYKFQSKHTLYSMSFMSFFLGLDSMLQHSNVNLGQQLDQEEGKILVHTSSHPKPIKVGTETKLTTIHKNFNTEPKQKLVSPALSKHFNIDLTVNQNLKSGSISLSGNPLGKYLAQYY